MNFSDFCKSLTSPCIVNMYVQQELYKIPTLINQEKEIDQKLIVFIVPMKKIIFKIFNSPIEFEKIINLKYIDYSVFATKLAVLGHKINCNAQLFIEEINQKTIDKINKIDFDQDFRKI